MWLPWDGTPCLFLSPSPDGDGRISAVRGRCTGLQANDGHPDSKQLDEIEVRTFLKHMHREDP